MAARSSSPSTSHGRANDAGPLRLADLGGTNTTLGPDHHPPGRRSPSPSLSLSTLSSAGGGGGGQGMYPRLDDPTVTMPRYPDVHDTDSGHLSPRSPVNTNNDASAMSTLAFAFTESDAALADEFAESLTLVFRGDLPSGGPALFDHYAAICERRVECLVGERDDAAHNKRPTAILDTLDAELVGVRAEAQSWRLIESILSWRMGHVDAPTLPPNPIHSDRLIEADALSRNTDGLLELKLVQRWLENHLDKFLDKKLVSLSVSAVRTGTLDAAGTVPAPAGPDSTETLFKAIFALLQAGNRDLAILTAESTSNPWVADAIRGSDRWHATADENWSSLAAVMGNSDRGLWKSVCWSAASDPSLGLYERATYALLSGRLDRVLPACHTYEQVLHAIVTCVVAAKLDALVDQAELDRGASVPSDSAAVQWSLAAAAAAAAAPTSAEATDTGSSSLPRARALGPVQSEPIPLAGLGRLRHLTPLDIYIELHSAGRVAGVPVPAHVITALKSFHGGIHAWLLTGTTLGDRAAAAAAASAAASSSSMDGGDAYQQHLFSRGEFNPTTDAHGNNRAHQGLRVAADLVAWLSTRHVSGSLDLSQRRFAAHLVLALHPTLNDQHGDSDDDDGAMDVDRTSSSAADSDAARVRSVVEGYMYALASATTTEVDGGNAANDTFDALAALAPRYAAGITPATARARAVAAVLARVSAAHWDKCMAAAVDSGVDGREVAMVAAREIASAISATNADGGDRSVAAAEKAPLVVQSLVEFASEQGPRPGGGMWIGREGMVAVNAIVRALIESEHWSILGEIVDNVALPSGLTDDDRASVAHYPYLEFADYRALREHVVGHEEIESTRNSEDFTSNPTRAWLAQALELLQVPWLALDGGLAEAIQGHSTGWETDDAAVAEEIEGLHRALAIRHQYVPAIIEQVARVVENQVSFLDEAERLVSLLPVHEDAVQRLGAERVRPVVGLAAMLFTRMFALDAAAERSVTSSSSSGTSANRRRVA